jgi:redox-sensitive bicupin YhaK (pirin superfamily)
MGLRSLRVINDDRVRPASGFGMHPHRDMEIITYVIEGALEHKDSLGSGSVLHAGEVQHITAGTGIRHSEFNPSATEPVHLLQIWLLPERPGLQPSYEEQRFSQEEKRGRLRLIAARDGREGAVTIHQDVDLYAGLLQPGDKVVHPLQPGRAAWLQVARGTVALNGQVLQGGDGAAIQEEKAVQLDAQDEAEILLFDLA